MFANVPEDVLALRQHENDEKKIRKLARKEGLVAKSRRGLWYIANERNYLLSPECGMDDQEAINFLVEDDARRAQRELANWKFSDDGITLVKKGKEDIVNEFMARVRKDTNLNGPLDADTLKMLFGELQERLKGVQS